MLPVFRSIAVCGSNTQLLLRTHVRHPSCMPLETAWYQASDAMWMRCSLFRDVTQRSLVVTDGRDHPLVPSWRLKHSKNMAGRVGCVVIYGMVWRVIDTQAKKWNERWGQRTAECKQRMHRYFSQGNTRKQWRTEVNSEGRKSKEKGELYRWRWDR